jgi:hypothetical protein
LSGKVVCANCGKVLDMGYYDSDEDKFYCEKCYLKHIWEKAKKEGEVEAVGK